MIFEKVDIFEAEAHLSKIIQSVESGQGYYITKRGVKVTELRPIVRERRSLRGGCAGKSGYWMSPDFNDTPADFGGYM